METKHIWDTCHKELFYFILKKVKSRTIAKDVFQNTFLKIHQNIASLKNKEKARAWAFQIARNEINNHFNTQAIYITNNEFVFTEEVIENYQHICCFDTFIENLPLPYKQVIELLYLKGYKQKQVANKLHISLENVKIRVKRAKEILKNNFLSCCKYHIDKNGKLAGSPNCVSCKQTPKE